LRQRVDDIPLLVDYFLDRLAARQNCPRPTISEATLAELKGRPWFGNVRELRNAIEHGMIMARGGMIAVEHLPAPMLPATGGSRSVEIQEEALANLIRAWTEAQMAAGGENLADLHERFLRLVEPTLLATVMKHSGGQFVSAARRLGLHRTTLRKRLDELGLGGGVE
jgi:two-component system nitrogen regulation response regulator GlnG